MDSAALGGFLGGFLSGSVLGAHFHESINNYFQAYASLPLAQKLLGSGLRPRLQSEIIIDMTDIHGVPTVLAPSGFKIRYIKPVPAYFKPTLVSPGPIPVPTPTQAVVQTQPWVPILLFCLLLLLLTLFVRFPKNNNGASKVLDNSSDGIDGLENDRNAGDDGRPFDLTDGQPATATSTISNPDINEGGIEQSEDTLTDADTTEIFDDAEDGGQPTDLTDEQSPTATSPVSTANGNDESSVPTDGSPTGVDGQENDRDAGGNGLPSDLTDGQPAPATPTISAATGNEDASAAENNNSTNADGAENEQDAVDSDDVPEILYTSRQMRRNYEYGRSKDPATLNRKRNRKIAENYRLFGTRDGPAASPKPSSSTAPVGGGPQTTPTPNPTTKPFTPNPNAPTFNPAVGN